MSKEPETAKLMVRMPEALRTAIKIEAAKNRRSANAEVLDLLSEAYEPYTPRNEIEPRQPSNLRDSTPENP